MGKDLKGREIGAGVYQRKDKKYSARFVSKVTGKRVEKYFDKPAEAKKWFAEAKYEDEHNKRGVSTLAITMDTYVHIADDEKEKEMKKFKVAFGAV